MNIISNIINLFIKYLSKIVLIDSKSNLVFELLIKSDNSLLKIIDNANLYGIFL